MIKDVQIDTDLNQYVWNKRTRNIPGRVRIRLTRKIDNESTGESRVYTHAGLVSVDAFNGD